MYAIVETGGKQYKVAKNDVIEVDLLKAKPGAEIKLTKVLLAKDGNTIHVGKPHIKGAQVICEAISSARKDKVIAFKYKKRKSEKKKIGHRRDVTLLKVKEIEAGKD